jgi:hypothetical protein
MDLKDILAISGQPGLYKFISQGRNAIIVENLETKKRMSAFGSERVSSLEDISIFTDDEDLPLVDVFRMINEKEGNNPAIDPKSSAEELKQYIADIVPEYDRDRVYPSDIKKILMWYNLLLKLDMLTFEEEEAKEEKEKEKEEEKPKAEKEEKKSAPAKKKTAGEKKPGSPGKASK